MHDFFLCHGAVCKHDLRSGQRLFIQTIFPQTLYVTNNHEIGHHNKNGENSFRNGDGKNDSQAQIRGARQAEVNGKQKGDSHLFTKEPTMETTALLFPFCQSFQNS